MSKKPLGIQEIKYGEVHCFYPLKGRGNLYISLPF